MKLSDLFESKDFPIGKLRISTRDTLPPIAVIPELDFSNYYGNYRFMTSVAAALSVDAGEHPGWPEKPAYQRPGFPGLNSPSGGYVFRIDLV